MRALVVLLLAAIPIAEIYVLFQVGQAIGPWWTILLLIATSVFGAWLARREMQGAWRAARTAVDTGRPPTTALSDGAIITAGGFLMVLPGFITDVIGLLLLLPFVRPLVRKMAAATVGRYAQTGMVTWVQARSGFAFGGYDEFGGHDFGGHDIVQGEVVDNDETGTATGTDTTNPPPQLGGGFGTS